MRRLGEHMPRVLTTRSGAVGFTILVFVFAVAIFGPIFVHLSPFQNPADAYLPPSWPHPLGTDFLGQDILTQIVIGTRPVLEVGLLTAIFAVGFGD